MFSNLKHMVCIPLLNEVPPGQQLILWTFLPGRATAHLLKYELILKDISVFPFHFIQVVLGSILQS